MNLRSYQSDIINQCRDLMKSGVKSLIVTAPTGSGKTLLTAHMIKTAASKGMGSWFVVHRRELVKQSIKAFHGEGVKFGVIASGFQADTRYSVQIASIQTLARRHSRFKAPKLIVWDESHHISAGTWSKLYSYYPDAFHIGLTATPSRLDGSGLDKYFKSMVKGPSVAWLIENKFLSPYKLYAPSYINTDSLHVRMGDYVKSELSAIVDKPTITGDAIAHYKKLASGKRAVVFAVSVEHSKHIVEQFLASGIPAEHVDGKTPTEERDAAIKRFTDGETKILSNVELFGEGFDLPAIEAAILLRPTQSIVLFLQQIGRTLRVSPGKDHAIILDHAGNCQRHGLPDEEREWDLKGRKNKGRAKNASGSVKICPHCFAAQPAGLEKCNFCNFIFDKNPREVEEVEGTLVEVDPETIRRERNKEQGRAGSLQELIALGRKRGYKNPSAWARYVYESRLQKR